MTDKKSGKSKVTLWENKKSKNKSKKIDFNDKKFQVDFSKNPEDAINKINNIQKGYRQMQDKIESLKEQANKVPELEAKIRELQDSLIELLTVRVDNIEEFLKSSINDQNLLSTESKKLFERINSKYSD